MKKTCFILSSLLYLTVTAGAQTKYLPVLEDGKVWKCAVVDRDYGADRSRDTVGYYRVAVDGDTLVGDRTYRKILVQDWATHQFVSSFAAYEENGRVYQVNDGQLDVFFDVSLSLFDTTFFPASPVAVDTINVGGVLRKRIKMDSGVDHLVTDDLYFTIVEGIGISKDEFTYSFREDGSWPGVGVAPEGKLCCMLECYKDGKLLFTAKDFKAQPYKPLLQEGKEWCMRSVYPPRGADEGFYRKISGDTLINGVSYKKMINGESQFVDGLREEGKKVCSAEGGELFDFNLQEGDTLYSAYGTVVVSTNDSIRVDGHCYSRLGIAPADLYEDTEDDGFSSPWEYWVEGIGSSFGIYPIWGMYIIGPHNELDSCKVDGRLLFTRNDFLRVPHSGRQWVHSSYAQVENQQQTYWIGDGRRTYATIGEAELNGRTYQKVYDCTSSSCAGNDADKRYKYLFAMRNEDGRVLADAESYAAAYPKAVTEYPQNDAGEFILYDYNAHVGDAYLGRADITVEQEGDTLLADGQPHRLLVLSTGHRLVEGIGCVNAGGDSFAYLCHPAYTSPVTYVTLLETYYDAEGHRVYVNTRERLCEQLLAGVEPVVSKSTARTDASAVYDLQGRRMDGRNLPKGIYIQGGKKFVVK